MKPSQFWWLQILNIALVVAVLLLPGHEGPQTIIELVLFVTNIFNNAMDLPETDRQKLIRTGILFGLITVLIPFTWGRPLGWMNLLLFPLALFSFVMPLRRQSAIKTSLSH